MTVLHHDEASAPAPAGADARVVMLGNDLWQVDVVPGTGASVSAGRIRTADGVWRDLLRPTRRTVLGEPEKCASFPMVPWSNRIRDGRLEYGGRTWQLQRNGSDGTAIHGATRHAAWHVTDRGPEHVTLEIDTADLVGTNFPWHFRSRLTYRVTRNRLTVTTSVQNTDREPFPAGFGHHPYLQRTLAPAVGSPLTPAVPAVLPGNPVLQVPARRGYALQGAMATGPAGAVPARADFSTARPLGYGFVDDVLTGWEPGTPVRITWDDPSVLVELHADAAYEHLVVYAPRRRSFFAVEPVTNVNDGFALHARGVPGTGVFELQPGEERTGEFSLTVHG